MNVLKKCPVCFNFINNDDCLECGDNILHKFCLNSSNFSINTDGSMTLHDSGYIYKNNEIVNDLYIGYEDDMYDVEFVHEEHTNELSESSNEFIDYPSSDYLSDELELDV